jgi:glyoxylase-like metal-dependent hydrolase (beta-lactamase superfamily II)
VDKTRSAPGIRKWRIGKVTATRILEMDTLVIPPESMLKTTTGTVLEYDWLQSHYATPKGRLLTHIQTFVLEIGDLRIMVDPCIGNHKPRQGPAFFNMLNTPFLEYLGEAGFPPETIDVVLCTHLHLDHVGWNTRLENGKWVPTFPNARYLFSRIEFEHTKNDNRLKGDETFSDSVQPIMDAGLGQLVS